MRTIALLAGYYVTGLVLLLACDYFASHQDGAPSFYAAILFATIATGCLGYSIRSVWLALVGSLMLCLGVESVIVYVVYFRKPTTDFFPEAWLAMGTIIFCGPAFVVSAIVGVIAALRAPRPVVVLDRRLCPHCGYYVFGLLDPRCPGCGRDARPTKSNS